MKSFMSIILLITAFINGHSMQIDLIKNPEKYNMISVTAENLPAPAENPSFDGFVQLSEINMHYLIFGEKDKTPLILIHGNGGSVKSLTEAATYLANDYTVYVTESRCHGQSTDAAEISYKLMAKDIYEFTKILNIEKPIIMGHSDGGIIALQIAADYPDMPKAIISCGANTKPEALWPYFTLGVRIKNTFNRTKLNDMMLTLPQFTDEYLSKIKCPTYVVCGENDIMMLSDTVFIHECIKGSDMAVIKGENHGSYISKNGKKAYVIATDWLSEKGLV